MAILLGILFFLIFLWCFIYVIENFDIWRSPEAIRYWCTLYFGEPGSGKTLHEVKQIKKVVKYYRKLWKKNLKLALKKGVPLIKHGIICTNIELNKELQKDYAGIYYFTPHFSQLRLCPRLKCWRKPKDHPLHGAVVIFQDVANVIPAQRWYDLERWVQQYFTECRHLGIHWLIDCQSPDDYAIQARRITKMAFRFDKLMGSDDPDETLPKLKRIWGIYERRKIKAEWLWKFGNLSPEEIGEIKEGLKAKEAITGKKHWMSFLWKISYHWIGKNIANSYDTTELVSSHKPLGYLAKEIPECIEDTHNHTDKTLDNYTSFKAKEHILV